MKALTLAAGSLALSCALAAVAVQAAPAPAPPVPDSPEVLRHVSAARAMAGDRFVMAQTRYCLPRPQRKTDYEDTVIPPAKVFDNFYFLGLGDVYAWAVDTADGIVLIDALNNTRDAQGSIEGGLRQLGLDPARIKYIVVSHAHGDHYGGAKYLAEKYKARVISSPTDWDGMPAAADRFKEPAFSPPPARDMEAPDGMVLNVGGTPFTFIATPGHTPGSLSVVFPVREGGRSHMAAVLNGTAAPSAAAMRQMIVSHEQLAARFKTMRVEVVVANHSFADDSLPRLEQARRRKAGEPNPFLFGEKVVQDYIGFHTECLRADVARNPS